MIDAHIHLSAENIFNERKTVLKQLEKQNVKIIFSCTASKQDFRREDVLRKEENNLYSFYGIHPWYVNNEDYECCGDIVSKMKDIGVIGVGEIGLDALKPNHYTQKRFFETQVKIASEANKLMNIHNVKADDELIDVLKKNKNLPHFILHSFNAQEVNVKTFISMGAYFSFSHRIMARNDEYTNHVLKKIPIERILVESDYDDVSKPFEIYKTLEFIADKLKTDVVELEKILENNLRRIVLL